MLDIPKHYIDIFKCRLTEIESVFKAVDVSKNFFLLIKLVQNTIINLSVKVKGFSVSLKRKKSLWGKFNSYYRKIYSEYLH